jgi:hypothetical protein
VHHCLLLESSQSNTNSSRDDREWDQQESKVDTGRKSNEWDFHIVGKKEGIKSERTGGSQVEGRWSNLKGTGDNRKKERGSLNQEKGNKVEKKLLVVGSNGQESQVFSDWQQLFDSDKIDTVLLQLGEESGINGSLEKVELANTTKWVVLFCGAGEKEAKETPVSGQIHSKRIRECNPTLYRRT